MAANATISPSWNFSPAATAHCFTALYRILQRSIERTWAEYVAASLGLLPPFEGRVKKVGAPARNRLGKGITSYTRRPIRARMRRG